MIDLSAYNPSHLQSCRAVLVQAASALMRLAEVRQAIELRLAPGEEPPRPETRVGPPSLPHCPECGGVLLPVANGEGLLIMGCKKCRYSRIEGEV